MLPKIQNLPFNSTTKSVDELQVKKRSPPREHRPLSCFERLKSQLFSNTEFSAKKALIGFAAMATAGVGAKILSNAFSKTPSQAQLSSLQENARMTDYIALGFLVFFGASLATYYKNVRSLDSKQSNLKIINFENNNGLPLPKVGREETQGHDIIPPFPGVFPHEILQIIFANYPDKRLVSKEFFYDYLVENFRKNIYDNLDRYIAKTAKIETYIKERLDSDEANSVDSSFIEFLNAKLKNIQITAESFNLKEECLDYFKQTKLVPYNLLPKEDFFCWLGQKEAYKVNKLKINQDDNLNNIAAILSNIKELEISYHCFGRCSILEDLESTFLFRNLHTLKLSDIDSENPDDRQDQQAFEKLESSKIKCLDLNFEYLESTSFEAISKIKSLRQLTIKNCKNLTNEICGYLCSNLSKLTHLNIEGCINITDLGNLIIADPKNLTHLVLSGTGIKDENLKDINQLTQLTHLDLSNTAVTKEGLEHVAKQQNLTHLKFNNCVLSIEDMEEIRKSLNLNKVEIDSLNLLEDSEHSGAGQFLKITGK